MPYEFTPEERLAQIMWVLKELNQLLHECDTRHEMLWLEQIAIVQEKLTEAITDMKPKEQTNG